MVARGVPQKRSPPAKVYNLQSSAPHVSHSLPAPEGGVGGEMVPAPSPATPDPDPGALGPLMLTGSVWSLVSSLPFIRSGVCSAPPLPPGTPTSLGPHLSKFPPPRPPITPGLVIGTQFSLFATFPFTQQTSPHLEHPLRDPGGGAGAVEFVELSPPAVVAEPAPPWSERPHAPVFGHSTAEPAAVFQVPVS